MTILSEACKPDNFELHNSLKLSFKNILGLHSNFVDFEFFLESTSLLRKDNLLHGTRKLCKFLLMFSIGFISLSVLLLFPVSITFFVFVHGFSFYFI